MFIVESISGIGLGSLKVEDLDRYRPIVKALATRLCYSEAVAEDITQETILRAVLAIQQGTIVSNPKAWLKRITVNCSHNYLEKVRNEEHVLCASEERQCSANSGEDVRLTLQQLKSASQVILALAFGEGLSHREIADVLDIPIGTVASRIHTAKEEFRAVWGANHE